STLGRALAERAGFTVLRSDVVRKELAGTPRPQRPAGPDEGIYAPGWTERTYAEGLRPAEALLFEGKRVLVDATFGRDRPRQEVLGGGGRWGVPGLLLLCRADPEVVRQRLARRRGDASDADWSVHQLAAGRWEEPGPLTRPYTHELRAGADVGPALAEALEVL